jgi:ankyrin repeat protein
MSDTLPEILKTNNTQKRTPSIYHEILRTDNAEILKEKLLKSNFSNYSKLLPLALSHQAINIIMMLLTEFDITNMEYLYNTNTSYYIARDINLPVLKILIDKGLDLNSKISNDNLSLGENILKSACRSGHVEIIKYLIQMDIIISKEGGESILLDAVACLDPNIDTLFAVIYLIENNVNPNAKNGRIFIDACTIGNIEIVKYLINNGVDSLYYDKGLFCAAEYSQPEIIKILLDAGAYANNIGSFIDKQNFGDDWLKTRKLLLENGADPIDLIYLQTQTDN